MPLESGYGHCVDIYIHSVRLMVRGDVCNDAKTLVWTELHDATHGIMRRNLCGMLAVWITDAYVQLSVDTVPFLERLDDLAVVVDAPRFDEPEEWQNNQVSKRHKARGCILYHYQTLRHCLVNDGPE